MQAVDFQNSYLLWITKDRKINGRFSIEATCRITDIENNILQEYYLLSGVMASNVFEGNGLIKNPPYLYQAVFSQNEFKIFRTFFFQQNILDDFGFILDRFEKVETVLKRKNFEEYNKLSTHHKAETFRNSMNGSISGHINQKYKFTLEFPIKHINIDDQNIQVETGNIIFPDFKEKMDINNLKLSFVTIRNFTLIEFCCYKNLKTTEGLFRFYNEIFKANHDFSLLINKETIV